MDIPVKTQSTDFILQNPLLIFFYLSQHFQESKIYANFVRLMNLAENQEIMIEEEFF